MRYSERVPMQATSVNIPPIYLKGIDDLVRRGLYPHRSEAIRVAIRDLLQKEGR